MRAHRSAIIRVGAFVVAIAVLVTVAIVAQGFDVKQTPLRSSTIWAINKSATETGTSRYARVNTALDELDTVKPAAEASSIVQAESSVVLLTNNDGKYADVDPADPQEFAADSKLLQSAPSGTPKQVASTGGYVAYLTDGGAIYIATLGDSGLSDPVSVDPYADEATAAPADGTDDETTGAVSDVVAISATGVLYSYSSRRGSVVGYDLVSGKRVSDDAVSVPAGVVDALQLTVVADSWVLFNGSDTIWTARDLAGTSVSVPAGADAAPLLQQPSASGASVYLASPGGLYSVPLSGGATVTEFEDSALGTPAMPSEVDGVMYAAWLPASVATAGTLWSSADVGDAHTPLDFAGQTGSAAPEPVIRSNGGTTILNDDATGWVWTVPDGALVPSSQNWQAGESDAPQSDPTQEEAQDLVEPKPPTANDDTFGVRPGEFVTLPVLLNDSDPNTSDVLTVVPTAITGLDGGFGTFSVTTNNQRVAVRVAGDATGTATFDYAVTDGVSKDVAQSHATVTLRVVDDDSETAPQWCGDSENGCAQAWPTLEVAPGGSGSANVLDQWVDPEGDALYVQSVAKDNLDERGDVGVTQDGRVFFQDQDANDTTGAQVALTVTVADARGQSTEKSLTVVVTGQPTLTALPLAVTTTVGDQLAIDPSPYISGVSGVYSITQAVPSDPAATVTPDSAATGLDFTTGTAGTYVIRYDLTDSAGQVATADARVTVLPADGATLTTAPITVFVRPGLDATVDVFSAVSNPAGQLLILSSATPAPIEQGTDVNALTADVVGHGLLRVTGSTYDGQPGLVGQISYVVTDGGAGAGSTVRGVASVMLLPPQSELAPIAVNDAVTVRAGAQVDIPVLVNDVAVDGGAMVLNPDSTTLTDSSASTGGLAFVSGSTVRYLAPAQAGVYLIDYQVYAAGAPTKFGTGTVQVTVTASGENQDPRPGPLDARVVAGQSVQLPFDSYGVDPDGDTVILDRIVTQPTHGTATISSRGDQITYTAFADYVGTDTLTYQVKDPDGGVGTAVARIGVVSTDTGSTPVTFTDYVEVQEGADNVVDVSPAENDLDPLGKPLAVSSVTPFAVAGSDEYASLAALIVPAADGSDVTANTVRLGAGTGLGTKTFQYVVTDGLNPAVGYIVLNVVAASVPDVPRVADSYVSVDDRAAFASTGIDVITGKVSWLSGDVNALTVELVDPPTGFRQNGVRISGPLPTGGSVLVAFRVTGVSSITKERVSSYGFLRIPGPDDIILSLRADAKTVSVDENGAPVTLRMADFVSVPAGATLQINADAVKSVSRQNATCTVTGTSIRYTPGAGSPYSDACLVPVKLDFQKTYTALLVPVSVVPEQPLPSFNPASLSGILPGIDGDVHTLDLTTMVTWDGPSDASRLAFTIDKPDPKKFVTTLTGTVLSVRAKGGVAGGTRAVVTVHFAGTYASTASVGIVNLTTSAPPPSYPKGGSVSATCFISEVTCDPVTVIGAPGEVNTLDDGALTVVSSVNDAACPGITFSVRGKNQIVASWKGTPDGLACETSFVVKDVNGFQSSGDRNGTIHWSFQGLPRPPASITQVSYGDGRIGLQIDPGKASDAYPKLVQFVVRQDGSSKAIALCNPNGSCPAITGLTNLDHHKYSAYAVNDNGEESTEAAVVEAWSFAKPSLGTVTTASVYDPAWTDPRQGLVQIVIAGSDKSVTGYKISGSDATVSRTGASTSVRLAYKVGTASIKITPVTESDPPPGSGPKASDAAGMFSQRVASLPAVSGFTTRATANSVSLVGVTAERNNSDRPLQVIYVAYKVDAPVCSVDANGGNLVASGGDGLTSSTSPTLGPLDSNETYTLFACASNGYGLAVSGSTTAFTSSRPGKPPVITYTVSGTPVYGSNGSGFYQLTLDNEADGSATGDAKIDARWTNWNTNTHTTDQTNVDPAISVVWCVTSLGSSSCGDARTAVPSANSATRQALVTGNTDPKAFTCAPGGVLGGFAVDVLGGHGTISVRTATYTDALGVQTVVTGSDAVPADAVSVSDVGVRMTWTAGDPLVANFAPYDWTAIAPTGSVDCPEP